MNIAMFTNDYKPIIGGVSSSISTFTEDLQAMGQKVLIVTLEFPSAEVSDESVIRLPAIKEVAGTQFSAKLPGSTGLTDQLEAFAPDIIHSHHPFMVGDTALRVARQRGLPLVFTHHTLYERYAYLFSRESRTLEQIAVAIATEYANLCNLVLAPTHSIKELIESRGVHVPVEIIPTGIDIDAYSNGDRSAFRKEHKIPQDAFVLGYLGRVVEAKNMGFLTKAAVPFLQKNKDSWFLVVGEGESIDEIRRQIRDGGVADRVVLTGSLTGTAAADAYAAMDVFGFASKTETQGIVLIESLCAGVPVIALDAPGARDILKDKETGLLLDEHATCEEFASAIKHVKDSPDLLSSMRKESRRRAQEFNRKACAEKLLDVYTRLRESDSYTHTDETNVLLAIQEGFGAEWDLFTEKLAVITATIASDETA